MKKISGYTVFELIIVMLISLIVVSIAYKVYDIVLRNYYQHTQYNERISRISLLDVLLMKDFSESKYVIRNGNGIECFYTDKKVAYEWQPGFVVRNEEKISDTFEIEAENVYFKYGALPVSTTSGVIDYLGFEVKKGDHLQYFIYRKVYAADFLIQHDELNKN